MTFIIKTRGAGGLILCEYRCPAHGLFEALVQRDGNGDAPDHQPCPVPPCDFCGGRGTAVAHTAHGPVVVGCLHGCEESDSRKGQCGKPSPWTVSAPPVHTQFVVSATQGKSDAKPHANSMDTRPIGEGQTMTEWRKERKAVWEEQRKKRVMEFDG